MMTLLDTTLPRTIDALVARFTAAAPAGARIEAWVFEDAAQRSVAERVLAQAGVSAQFFSAYKPLLHFMLDDVDLAGVGSIAIRTPAHPDASAGRFALEAYPLTGLLEGVAITFAPGEAGLDYEVAITRGAAVTTHRVFAPNRSFADHLGQPTLAPCGWLRVWHGDTLVEDGRIETEFEATFRVAMQAVAAHPWGAAQPYCETLVITVETAGIERTLDYCDECLSTREALHEDLYFSLLEFFQKHAGKPPGDRTVQPGQIIPDIRPSDGATRVRVTLQPPVAHPIAAAAAMVIETATRPLTPDEIAAEVDRLGGMRFDGRSFQGRVLPATHIAAEGPGLVISAGQHANETSGIVGALRAGKQLAARGTVNFALIPLANPDGHALHHWLRETHPRHMHHAARYTALGDDLEFRKAAPYYEKATRLEAYRRTGAGLHLNLHGYPSHEWTRPLTGYAPPRFSAWAIPRGYFLIAHHAPGLSEQAHAFLRALAEAAAAVPGLRDYNERHLATYFAHTGTRPDLIHDSVPCLISETASPDVPLTVITEYPDETIYDDAFRLAHDVQTATVLAAVDLYLRPGGLAEVIAGRSAAR